MRRKFALLIVSGLFCAGLAVAQPDFEPPPGLESIESRFEGAPEVGTLFPDVTIVDDQGQPVNIRSLAADKPYTVLTLGCLT